MSNEQSIIRVAANKWWESLSEEEQKRIVAIYYNGYWSKIMTPEQIEKMYLRERTTGKSTAQFSEDNTSREGGYPADQMNEKYLKLKKDKAILRAALRNIVKSHRPYDMVEYAKEALNKTK